MKPTIGRIVHYKDAQGIAYPAIITIVDNADLTLTVFDNSQTTPGVMVTDKDMAAGPREAKAGQWWWPERL